VGAPRGGYGEIPTVVHFAGAVLAAGFAGLGAVPVRLADLAAVSDRGNRGRGRSRIAAGDIVPACTDFARTARSVR
jgi:hypothetical protein